MTTYEPYHLIHKPMDKNKLGCMAALPLLPALVLKHTAKVLLKKARGR